MRRITCEQHDPGVFDRECPECGCSGGDARMTGVSAKAVNRRLAPQVLYAGTRVSLSVIRCAVAFLLLCLAPAFQAFPAHAYSARVVDVSEGDIITIEPALALGSARETVRLHGKTRRNLISLTAKP